MHTALKNLWASVAIDAGAVLDRDRSGAGDLTLKTSGLRPADRSRPSDLTLAGWGGAACDYMIDFACVSSTTPTWSNDPRWCIPGIAATEAEHAKLAADRASSAPVQGVHRYYPFVVEDRGRLGKSALTVVYIFASFADDCGAATAAAHVPRVFDEYCTELSKVGLMVQDSKTRYVRHPGDSESELRTVREKLAPGGFRTPADDPVQDGAVYLGAPISHYPEWMTGALGRRREAHATLLERIASFGTSGYGCHHGAMRLLVVCAVRQTGFLSRMMPPSELDPFLEAVDAANISAAFSLLGLDACDQSTPRMEAAIVQMSMPADFGGLNLALLQSEAPAAFYSAQSVVLPKLVREYGPALGPLYEAVRAEVSSVATSALPWARETRRVYETLPTYWCSGLAT
eukprot:jgi/Tetstr1/429187/TSEL_019140.t1